MLPKFTERIRGLFYRINGPLGALLGFYGIASEKLWALWVALISSVMSNTLAIDNTSIDKKEEDR